ncbi:hypothetical protein MUN74_02530 [Agromyces endophyticus]|uniref:hypothetical protein n=1 Tax=Agromyces sp. H17E-10 TaxID=2932244 RepID=UPI001FD5338D|nr:hypothetical protein [Agromyces sp. H17E-10]UOQ89816.1 hypothetical protein MUN74_02530 [Agromyces sp. H17E-10]
MRTRVAADSTGRGEPALDAEDHGVIVGCDQRSAEEDAGASGAHHVLADDDEMPATAEFRPSDVRSGGVALNPRVHGGFRGIVVHEEQIVRHQESVSASAATGHGRTSTPFSGGVGA